MSYGFEVRNSSGRVILTEQMACFRIVNEGYSYSHPGPGAAAGEWYNDFPTPAEGEILVIRCTTHSYYTLVSVASVEGFSNRDNYSLTFHWMMLKHAVTSNVGGWGMHVMAADGSIIFNSNDIQFPTINTAYGAAYASGDGPKFPGVSVGCRNGVDYFMPCYQQTRYVSDSNYPQWDYRYMFGITGVSGNAVSLWFEPYWDAGEPADMSPPEACKYLTAGTIIGYRL
jgi:hypothetical protein